MSTQGVPVGPRVLIPPKPIPSACHASRSKYLIHEKKKLSPLRYNIDFLVKQTSWLHFYWGRVIKRTPTVNANGLGMTFHWPPIHWNSGRLAVTGSTLDHCQQLADQEGVRRRVDYWKSVWVRGTCQEGRVGENPMGAKGGGGRLGPNFAWMCVWVEK